LHDHLFGIRRRGLYVLIQQPYSGALSQEIPQENAFFWKKSVDRALNAGYD
jgi:hypothetical protein